MRGGQQTQGGVAVRRNIVIRGGLSLLLVIRVVIRGSFLRSSFFVGLSVVPRTGRLRLRFRFGLCLS